ncbi:4-hydroxy-tetrahydrodipicolinate reductase [Candidatus Aquiluna sp. UB-MaderosW2red]|jgi:4-hydroxy-tetrahydrodipicolinate reductase|uniref:4-hydroxy-tetrahydrodipicolinate reductase n=1 Tax=Candidatus Aquiluna sp. UB-MaderosW2red TaxID=1855377 RepID=UPI000875AD22|nr:4-hydroxy-tetrahydrodipicolinate reductase [Candidatus Aquiluna sp. UB-MaderosW2red]SCX13452.1 4-hydroxy-tetrahydrodipicolinate reductase [Candidatus Aquiluna sp. UB-MaderosW2red]
MISVAILGASGRMGALTLELVNDAANLSLHAKLNSESEISQMLGADVIVDFTLPDVSPKMVEFAIEHDQKIVVGTSGWNQNKLAGLDRLLALHPKAAVLVIPNFSIGSMLAQGFAAQAAKYFDSIEIIEAHHAGKIDSPSGTAVRTAEEISKARSGMVQPLLTGVDQRARGEVVAGIPIHSIRVQGISAKQDVLFGGDSEVLNISHEVSSLRAYSNGIRLAIEFAVSATGLHVGLDKVV